MATSSARKRAARRTAPPVWRPQECTAFLIDSFGGVTNVARTLGVSASQPSRWRSGVERPGPETSRRLLDLTHVYSRALLLWEEPVARDWLQSPNAYLDHARPVDVLATRGASEVLDALDATQSGVYA